MALALNNLKRVDMPLNKETKPNQTIFLKHVLMKGYIQTTITVSSSVLTGCFMCLALNQTKLKLLIINNLFYMLMAL